MPYPLPEICKVLKADVVQSGKEICIDQLLLDSRKLIYPNTTLFIALVTPHGDGHQFIPSLYEKGVRAFLISHFPDYAAYPEATFMQVNNTLQSLQNLASWHRSHFTFPVIGITGSNGKTIVKEWLYQLLSAEEKIVRNPKSYNSQTGVPLSVWQMEKQHTLGIFEAGISQPGEMANLEKIIQPTIGIFTNIGDAHNEGFLNILQKIREKLLLFVHANVLIYCKDYPELNECILQFHGQMHRKEHSDKKPLRLLAWSLKTNADLRITSIIKELDNQEPDDSGTQTLITGIYEEKNISIRIPFTDKGSIENAIHCWCLMLWLNKEETFINEQMKQLTRVAMRLELKEAVNDCSLINDSYNSDLGSLSIALDFLSQQRQHPKHTLILSDILQSGRNEADLYKDVAGLLEQKGVSRLIGIGKNIQREKDAFLNAPNLASEFFPSTEDFIQEYLAQNKGVKPLTFEHETILLKGARSFQFEKISRLLEQKTHKTVLEINLNALTHNLKTYQSLLKPGVKIMAMVKAFSYGSGSYEIANLLQFHKVDYLAVAYADEGITLRRRGITIPIMVMNPEPGTFDAIIQWNLEPEIYSLRLLSLFENALKTFNVTAFPIHIKLDTGMHRLGFSEDDLPTLVNQIKNSTDLKVVSIFSHLAASDDPAYDGFTREQAQRFEKVSQLISKTLPYPVLRHLSNSSATTRHPELQYDMVRLGIGLYGVDSSQEISGKLELVSQLKTSISQIRKVKAGETVGYGRAGKVDKEKIIATIPIGYADGYHRSLGDGKGRLSINGHLAPTIGHICMDMLMVDISALEGIKENDSVIVFGDEPTLQQVAEWAHTIPYEILTGISQRVKRVYLQE